MTSRRVKFAVLVLWLAATACFIRYEAYPEWFTHVFGGYRSLFRDGQYVVDTWMQIFFQGQSVGYSHTWVDARPETPADAYIMRNRTVLMLTIMNDRHVVDVMTQACLDEQYRLRSFSFAMSSGEYRVRIEGHQTKGETFQVLITTPSDSSTISVKIPENAVLHSPMTELAMARLKPGQNLRIATLNPVDLSVADAYATALAREQIEVDGSSRNALKVKLESQGITINSWIDDEGKVLRQETPMGWVMEARTSETVDTTVFDSDATLNMLQSFQVPCKGNINNPREAAHLKLRMRMPAAGWAGWNGPRQATALENEALAVLTLSAQAQPEAVVFRPVPITDQALQEYLAASPFVQSDHPLIIKMAETIIGPQTNAWSAASLINEWVFKNIAKHSALSLPSALDVLRVRKGDCNEHTYLFVALARAAGIPARIHVGLVYLNGAFFYHAWPAVYVGEWIEMDPALGQETVDVTHITLLTGELKDQFMLSALFGQLSIEIIPEQPDQMQRR